MFVACGVSNPSSGHHEVPGRSPKPDGSSCRIGSGSAETRPEHPPSGRRSVIYSAPREEVSEMPAHDEQVERYDKQVHELQSQVKFLEEEVGLLRRRLTNAPRQVSILEEKLVDTREQMGRAMAQNQKLADALRAERDKIESLAQEVEKLSQPPASFGVLLSIVEDGSLDVVTAGRKMRVLPAPDLPEDMLRPGAQVV